MSALRAAERGAWLAALGLLAVAAWLLLPRTPDEGPARPPLVIALADASASVARPRGWLGWVRSELARSADEAAAAGAELAVLAFADGVATGFGPGPPERFRDALAGRDGPPYDPALALSRGATRLADALTAVELLSATPRPAVRLVLLGPATYTGPSPAGAWARLAAAGVACEVRTPPRAEESDLALLELALPARIEAGAPLVALVRGLFRPGTEPVATARLVLEVEEDGPTRTRAHALALPAGGGAFELPLALGPAGFGRTLVRARAELEGDAWPENDQVAADTLAGGARVLGVVVRPELRPVAETWLAPSGRSALAGLQFQFLLPEELPGALEDLAAVITFDLAPEALPAEALAPFVRRGGGWLALSGYGFLSGWIPGETEGELARLLPCEPRVRESPPRDVVLLVDGSGSMEGQPFETVRAAALELVAAALPSDRVSLRFFTGRLEPEHLLKRRSASRAADQQAARAAARDLLALRVPSGTTYLLAALSELARSAGEHETLALLLTDGWEREGLPDPLGSARALTAALRAARVRLVVIAVGAPNLALLAALAEGPENVRAGDTLDALRAVFHRELSGSQLAEGELALRPAPRAPGSLADEVLSAAAGQTLAPLERHVRNRLRPGAEALWESEEGEPVLALMRAGLGRTALFASRPGAPWASRYLRAGLGEPAEFDGLLRWLARGPTGAAGPTARAAGRHLVLEGLSREGAAERRVRLVAPGREAEDLRLLPPGGPAGDVLATREGWLAREVPPGAYLLLVDEPEAPVVPVAVGPGDELAWRERACPPAPAVQARAGVPPGRASHGLALAALALALAALFLAALAASRGQGLRALDR
ncbi:MAG TPA: vWA domain-containing protein [Planctomycetota bacterium]